MEEEETYAGTVCRFLVILSDFNEERHNGGLVKKKPVNQDRSTWQVS